MPHRFMLFRGIPYMISFAKQSLLTTTRMTHAANCAGYQDNQGVRLPAALVAKEATRGADVRKSMRMLASSGRLCSFIDFRTKGRKMRDFELVAQGGSAVSATKSPQVTVPKY